MTLAHSRLTAQGQISVPAEVRKKLGVGPGAVLEWHEQDGQVIVRRAGRYNSEDIHKILFEQRPPKARTIDEMKAGIRTNVKGRRARR